MGPALDHIQQRRSRKPNRMQIRESHKIEPTPYTGASLVNYMSYPQNEKKILNDPVEVAQLETLDMVTQFYEIPMTND